MKKILLWDPRFPNDKPHRLEIDDAIASACVRAGVATAADPAEAGALAVGGAIDPSTATQVILWSGPLQRRVQVFLPLAVAQMAVAAGVAVYRVGAGLSGGTPAPTPTPSPTSIGGVAINEVSSSGYTSGYRMIGGDDFAGALSLLSGSQTGLYPATRAYLTPAANQYPRGSSGLGGADVDPLWTGHNDANRGVPLVSFADSITQASSVLKLTQRPATAPEQALFVDPTKPVVSSMIHTARAMVARAPCIFEWYERRNATIDTHMTGWLMQMENAASVDDLELDWEADSDGGGGGDGRNVTPNVNTWTNGNNTPIGGTPLSPAQNTWHKYAFAIDVDGTCTFWLNDGLRRTYSGAQAKALAKSFYLLFTNHVYDADKANIVAPATYEIDWWRVWIPSANTHYAPLAADQVINVDFGAAFSVVLPTKTAIWGTESVTEVVEAFMAESNEPGGNTSGLTYAQLPSGITYNAGTRTLSGTVSDKAGRLNIVRFVKDSGSSCKPQLIALNVGPRINISAIFLQPGQTYDIYANCACGVLSAGKIISLTGLPTGATYNSSTGILTVAGGAADATATITINCTNSNGQTASRTITMIISAATPYTAWNGVGWYDASDSLVVASDVVTNINNKWSGGNLLGGGSSGSGQRAKVSGAKNGNDILRLTRDVSVGANVPRFSAASTDAMSTMWHGDDKPYTAIVAYMPTSDHTGYIWAASDTVNSTDSQQIALLSRYNTASSVRRQLTTAGAVDASWGSGQASNTARIVCVRFTGTAVTIWDTSTTKAVDAAAQDTATFNTELIFRLFASETNNATDPTIATTQRSLDFYEAAFDDEARSDAECVLAIQQFAAKWAITL